MKKIVLACLLTLPLLANDKLIELYESKTCGCCDLWAKYMQEKGYTLKVHKSDDFMQVKYKMNIKPEFQSCHTGIIAGYAIEGHMSESAVSWLLKEKPKNVIGLAVPGMPQGSAGMEQGFEDEEYPVIVMMKDGSSKLYGIYKGQKLIQKGEI
ncbi:DUF411 domain-containing protein [Campylobacter sp. MIT 12-8780]|uniref:DUF411 domain-containing protein n=1 Tax=unclassified Campylobacter TaxID=2593542 RepID=UPI00115E8FB7|nr:MULTISPECIES: DUF411 domain-containing protein [unclassified Campylobacter]NDJ27332.1 DUF411 domain-containing protein [Campylobacter sp. MIT 19-121]TQR40341.1 DUF411 domain-containing protein [Campylobacter sp. MIT 12-8780]